MKHQQRIIGRLIMVQESRFRLVTASGQTYLFSLSPAAGVDEMDLLDLYRTDTPVAVDYLGQANLDTGIVQAMTPLMPRAG